MNKFILGLIILVIGGLVGWYILSAGQPVKLPQPGKPDAKTTPTPTSVTLRETEGTVAITSQTGSEKGGVTARVVVTYTDSGFSPSPLSVKVGTTVTFVNESGRGMWVASAVHPTHQLLPGLDQLKSVAKGGSYEYTFTKAGTWKYHNHSVPGNTGSVVVTQ